MWVNYQKQHDFNPLHSHVGDLSFVTYLNVPSELSKEKDQWKGKGPQPGSIIFQFGVSQSMVLDLRSVLPKKGDFFLFPSTLNHMVVPFSTPNVERISVSGNINFLEK